MKEKLSAWIDGELSDQHARLLPPQLKFNAELRATWHHYHLIGDILRGMSRPDLCAKIFAQLDTEPTVLAPPLQNPKK